MWFGEGFCGVAGESRIRRICSFRERRVCGDVCEIVGLAFCGGGLGDEVRSCMGVLEGREREGGWVRVRAGVSAFSFSTPFLSFHIFAFSLRFFLCCLS